MHELLSVGVNCFTSLVCHMHKYWRRPKIYQILSWYAFWSIHYNINPFFNLHILLPGWQFYDLWPEIDSLQYFFIYFIQNSPEFVKIYKNFKTYFIKKKHFQTDLRFKNERRNAIFKIFFLLYAFYPSSCIHM